MEQMSHKLLGFVSIPTKESQLNRNTVEKKVHGITVDTFPRVEYLAWPGASGLP